MAIEQWSESVLVGRLRDDPVLADDLDSIVARIETDPCDVILDFAEVTFVSSSNLAGILRLRNELRDRDAEKNILLSSVGPKILSTFTVTGIDKLFDFAENLPMALAQLAIEE
ncbi:MAG: STAS domain-containing protein [Planctomycetota bacterium]